jgi:hypothetical protein
VIRRGEKTNARKQKEISGKEKQASRTLHRHPNVIMVCMESFLKESVIKERETKEI